MNNNTNWQWANSGAKAGEFNMQFDEAQAQALVQGSGHPTLRVYGWKPFALSLGHHQSLDEIDQPKAAADGIDIVRRPTGGRAILHSEELTYSVVMRVENRGILAVYDEISRALVAGLELLGIPVGIEKSQPHFPSLYKETSSAVCFSSAARYELKVEGKKLVGSAQRRFACSDGSDVVLQHGSIMIGPMHKRIIDYLKLPGEEMRERLRRNLDETTTEINAILHREVPFDEVAEAVKEGFERSWNVAFHEVSASASSVEMSSLK